MDEPLESLNIRGLCTSFLKGVQGRFYWAPKEQAMEGRIMRGMVKLSGTRDRVAWQINR
ncbi:hypothetical protein DSLASN_30870 [Desulfoluna limicola]|uniref:Uncharacterized protein n=1 Tax=Desulfoluna limicola TaxID=2810562 RepID=A0ABN6F6Y7_9BACT|nr:hypothetical protein DSLASN_30870 [Desulfoluna limicola]